MNHHFIKVLTFVLACSALMMLRREGERRPVTTETQFDMFNVSRFQASECVCVCQMLNMTPDLADEKSTL